jgi:hypothetical protein
MRAGTVFAIYISLLKEAIMKSRQKMCPPDLRIRVRSIFLATSLIGTALLFAIAPHAFAKVTIKKKKVTAVVATSCTPDSGGSCCIGLRSALVFPNESWQNPWPNKCVLQDYPPGSEQTLLGYMGQTIELEVEFLWDSNWAPGSPKESAPKKIAKVDRIAGGKIHDPNALGALGVAAVVMSAGAAGAQQVEANKAAQDQARLAAQQQAAQQQAAQQAAAQRQSPPPPRQGTYPNSQQSQTQTQSGSSASGGQPGGQPSNGSSGSARPAPQASNLGITQNWVDPACNGGVTNAHYEISNNSYYNATITVQLSYQDGGVQSNWNVTQNVGPRSVNDYIQQIPCGVPSQPGDYGNSNILQWQFY